MPKYSKVIKQARNLTSSRGHRLGKFMLTRIKTGNPPMANRGCMVAICEYCGSYAAVDRDSPSGSLEIWGEALGNFCPGKVLAEYVP